MEAREVIAKIRDAFPSAVIAEGSEALEPFVQIKADLLVDVMRFLASAPDLSFDFLMCITGIDLLGFQEPPVFRVLYHLFSYRSKRTIVVRVEVPREEPCVPSVSSVYPTALWHERETYDLLGIVFEAHGDLRRILLPEEWEGYPLRKDYCEAETALGYPTRRENLLDLIRGACGRGGE